MNSIILSSTLKFVCRTCRQVQGYAKKVRMKNIKILTLTLTLTLSFSGCQPKLINLETARKEVQQYYESGKYDEELNEIVKDAEADFDKIAVKENSVVIFDVDDTALSNYEVSKQLGFGYVYQVVQKAILSAKLPAIPQVKNLYDNLLNKGFKIIFLTGRNEDEYDATYKNLVEQGYAKFDTLIVREGEAEIEMKAQQFKSLKRTELTQKGYEIIGTVGDQWTDLEGEYHGIQVKIPNYLYLIED